MFKLHLLAFTAALAAASAPALAGTVFVPATDDIFLASQPNFTSVTGYFGSDTSPAASPISVTLLGNDLLTFAASGSASIDGGGCSSGPDGGCYSLPYDPGFGYEEPAPAQDTYQGPATALIGVFLPSGVTNVDEGPTSFNYNYAGLQNLSNYYPQLNQIFFIGDGSTTGAVVQSFYAPAGAVTLYLAVADSIGGSGNNIGGFAVTYTDAVATVPEPESWALMLVGLGAMGALVRRRSTRFA
jgi:hypothetical protein